MGSGPQSKKDQYAKKWKKKQKKRAEIQARQREFGQRTEIVRGSNARQRRRMSHQIPRAWAGEMPEDVAVFDDAVLATFAPDLAQQAAAVRGALKDALESRADDALKRVSVIGRNSPWSEWRLFVRGLVDWLADDAAAASEAWMRLNPERRPGRIAAAMMASLRPDPEGLAAAGQPQALSQPQALHRPSGQNAGAQSAAASPAPAWGSLDPQQLYHAKLLRRARFDRAALRVAEAGLSVREESEEMLLGPKRIQWLRQFIAEYRETEPELTAALAQTALRRAYGQNYSDLFDDAARSFSGPLHDRRNKLLKFLYYGRFQRDAEAARTAEQALNDYLDHDLPKNEALLPALRAAIASQIHLDQAMDLIAPDRLRGPLAIFLGPPEDPTSIRKHLLAAVKAHPANGAAYEVHADWIQAKLDDDRLRKPERARLEAELAHVMQSWAQGVTEAVAPRLWLVDHLLENEELDEARPHVEFLAASRQDDPRVRALPWKWQLLEAMRLCRRKAWLAEVPSRLDEAEALWPTWLPKRWLAYLRAGWTLRTGQREAFEEQRRQICQQFGLARDSLADACLMLGAVQQTRAAAAEIKPFRAAVDQALTSINTLPAEALFEAGSCFWDLHRAQLIYPAYRMQGKTIGKELLNRLAKTTGLVLEGIPLDGKQDERVPKAILWASEYRFWTNGYEVKGPPLVLNSAVEKAPLFAAARLNAFCKQRYAWGAEKYQALGPLLRAAAQGERDPYYRHWFVALADRLDDILASKASQSFGFPFGDLFGSKQTDDEDDILEYDPNCDCPDCQAAREAEKQRSFKPPYP